MPIQTFVETRNINRTLAVVILGLWLADAAAYSLPGAPIAPLSSEECNAIYEQYSQASNELMAQADQLMNQGHYSSPVPKLQNEGIRLGNEGSRIRNECMRNLYAAQQKEESLRNAEAKTEAEAKARNQQLAEQQNRLMKVPPSITKAYKNGKAIYKETKPYAEQQLQVPDKDRLQLFQAQAGNIVISKINSAMMDNARNSRNEYVDEVVNSSHERVDKLRAAINKASGTNDVVSKIQDESFKELKRQNNQIMGDLDNIRKMGEQFDGKGVSDSSASEKSQWQANALQSPQSQIETPNTGNSSVASSEQTTEPTTALHISDTSDTSTASDHRPDTGKNNSPVTQEYTDKSSDSGYGSQKQEELSIASATQTSQRPAGACDYFSIRSDGEQYWHAEGTQVCNVNIMYQCENSDWQRLGKCTGFSNWKMKMIQKLEKIH